MLLKAKKIAFLGLLLAFTVVLVVITGIIDFSTLFLLAGASFCVGIAFREQGLRLGSGFYIAATILSFILAANKLYCLTFAAMGLYVVITEFAWEWLSHRRKNCNMMFWLIKYLTFNVLYIPALIIAPNLFYQGDRAVNSTLFLIFFIGGQLVLFIYDRAYEYFQRFIWGKVRKYFI